MIKKIAKTVVTEAALLVGGLGAAFILGENFGQDVENDYQNEDEANGDADEDAEADADEDEDEEDGGVVVERLGVPCDKVRLPLSVSPHYFLWHPGGGRIQVAPVRLGCEAMFYRLFHCRAFGRVEVGLPHIWESQGAGGGQVVDLGHSARCHDG
ncbi:hypothetical protein Hanom_Chr07g00638761 [Helianthus anomalus]